MLWWIAKYHSKIIKLHLTLNMLPQSISLLINLPKWFWRNTLIIIKIFDLRKIQNEVWFKQILSIIFRSFHKKDTKLIDGKYYVKMRREILTIIFPWSIYSLRLLCIIFDVKYSEHDDEEDERVIVHKIVYPVI